MAYETITLRKEEGIAHLTLNRPNVLNALNSTIIVELNSALDDLGNDNAVKVVILTGAGRAFCVGGDIQSFLAVEMSILARRDFIAKAGNIAFKMINLEKPIIAAVNGDAVGGGIGIVLACDIVIASEKARFGAVFSKVGLVPDTGTTYTLPRIVGQSKAKELCWTGEIFDAAEAQRLGIVSKVVPPEQLESTVGELAKKLASGPTIVTGFTKMIMNKGLALGDMAATIEYEAEAQAICFQTEDLKEGIQAFAEKRPPKFKGR